MRRDELPSFYRRDLVVGHRDAIVKRIASLARPADINGAVGIRQPFVRLRWIRSAMSLTALRHTSSSPLAQRRHNHLSEGSEFIGSVKQPR